MKTTRLGNIATENIASKLKALYKQGLIHYGNGHP